jgi:hypothetical protein
MFPSKVDAAVLWDRWDFIALTPSLLFTPFAFPLGLIAKPLGAPSMLFVLAAFLGRLTSWQRVSCASWAWLGLSPQ